MVTINSRIVNKHDIEVNWIQSNLIPKQGECIVYDIDENYNYERLKIGDGINTVSNLPFVTDSSKSYIDEQIKLVINLIYPIGSIYLSTVDTNPLELFGIGEWERIKDTFLLASGDIYENGTTGGESEHILTINEMPNHAHKLKTDIESPNYNTTWPNYWEYNEGWIQGPNSETEAPPTSTTSTGGGQPHNNMPPYLVVYMWKRIL